MIQLFVLLIGIGAPEAAPLTCSQLKKMVQEERSTAEIVSWIEDLYIVGEDWECIEALDLDPTVEKYARKYTIGAPPENVDPLNGVPSKEKAQRLMAAEEITWLGIDFSLAHLIDADEFNNPEDIIPEKFHWWNEHFTSQDLPRFERFLEVPLRVDTASVRLLNDATSASQIHPVGDGHTEEYPLDRAQVQEHIHGMELNLTSGIAQVWVVESMNKATERTCMHQVFFDAETRDVLSDRRTCEQAGGMVGMVFLFHWYHPFETATAKVRFTWKRIARAAE